MARTSRYSASKFSATRAVNFTIWAKSAAIQVDFIRDLRSGQAKTYGLNLCHKFDASRKPTVRPRWRPAIVALQAVKIEAVSKVPNLQKLGVVAKVAKQQAGRSRTFGAIKSAARTTLRSLGHALHQLWLEVTGTLFLAIALFGAVAFVHEYMQYQAGRATLGRVAVALCFTLAFAWFGLSSFWRVRRKSQRP